MCREQYVTIMRHRNRQLLNSIIKIIFKRERDWDSVISTQSGFLVSVL